MAPEYALWGHLTEKADVFSFGVVAMEIVSGKSNMKRKGSDDHVSLINTTGNVGINSVVA